LFVGDISLVIDETSTSFSLGALPDNRLASRIRTGKGFHPPDARYANARLACMQLYDIPLTITELSKVKSRCSDYQKAAMGEYKCYSKQKGYGRQSSRQNMLPLLGTYNSSLLKNLLFSN